MKNSSSNTLYTMNTVQQMMIPLHCCITVPGVESYAKWEYFGYIHVLLSGRKQQIQLLLWRLWHCQFSCIKWGRTQAWMSVLADIKLTITNWFVYHCIFDELRTYMKPQTVSTSSWSCRNRIICTLEHVKVLHPWFWQYKCFLHSIIGTIRILTPNNDNMK